MSPTKPIIITDLFAKLDSALIDLLRSLSAQDWEKQTIAGSWRVKDVAAHLLDGNLRALSVLRDQYFGEKPENINSYTDLVGFLNQLNADWVRAMRRVSPQVLVELLEITGKEFSHSIQNLNPFEKAVFSVAWAGEAESDNWFHVAREYTEKWHHQQQIRLALGKTDLLYQKAFYFPYLDTSMRALPHHYRNTQIAENQVIKFVVLGESGGNWYLQRNTEKWILVENCSIEPICEVQIAKEIAWRIFTKGIRKQEAEQAVRILGRQDIGNQIFDMLAVMA